MDRVQLSKPNYRSERPFKAEEGQISASQHCLYVQLNVGFWKARHNPSINVNQPIHSLVS